ncbi:hypothetical protein U2E86_10885 [Acinetobacter baumannii]|uniref:hypothetical protein n=1 Tax=Acinetobacter baumannii TaxID=470 RepID=UPI0021EFFD26|nr:hypothetical protein MWMV9_MWMV9_01575 [Acinetobacter baumannii]CAI3134897.1 hypothetical protein MWMV14_MWMV14_01591 [Acinetobacter baumannii]CAI3135288.1 hypothetical protein MWMV11_MWMV11_01590 [Acinetobacter baumannii]
MTQNLSISLRGFNDENIAKLVGSSILSCFNQMNEYIDISRLELISVGCSEEDYTFLLSEFRNELKATNDALAVGAGMTVVSDPKDLKFRVFFSGLGIWGLIKAHYENDESLLDSAIHTISHEFMHVYVGTELYTSYPELLTEIIPQNIHEELKWKTILSCWDEYRVCSLCAKFGENPHDGYRDILENTLLNFEDNILKAKSDISDWGTFLRRIYSVIHTLLKYSSYYLGTCIGLEIDYRETDIYIKKISRSWFGKYFDRLFDTLSKITKCFNSESYDINKFFDIAEILVDISMEYKVFVDEKEDNSVWVQLVH